MSTQRVPATPPERPNAQQSERALEAVLFDMDGTLVDTEPYWIAAEYRLVAEYGGTWNDAHAHELVGNSLERSEGSGSHAAMNSKGGHGWSRY